MSTESETYASTTDPHAIIAADGVEHLPAEAVYRVYDPAYPKVYFDVYKEARGDDPKPRVHCTCEAYDHGLNAACVHAKAVRIFVGQAGAQATPSPVEATYPPENVAVAPSDFERRLSVLEGKVDALQSELLNRAAPAKLPSPRLRTEPKGVAVPGAKGFQLKLTKGTRLKPAQATDPNRDPPSASQMKYVESLAETKGIDVQEYVTEAFDSFVEDLNGWAVAQLIDMLKAE